MYDSLSTTVTRKNLINTPKVFLAYTLEFAMELRKQDNQAIDGMVERWMNIKDQEL